MSDELLTMVRGAKVPFPTHLGIEITDVEPDRIRAELPVRQEYCTVPDILHGGAIMALADTLGAVGTVINLPPGATTTTIESKTNFLGAVPVGQKALAETTPLHRGKTTQVWQTKITREDGRVAAIVTQTQLVMARKTD